jgi:hypothetical protein
MYSYAVLAVHHSASRHRNSSSICGVMIAGYHCRFVNEDARWSRVCCGQRRVAQGGGEQMAAAVGWWRVGSIQSGLAYRAR